MEKQLSFLRPLAPNEVLPTRSHYEAKPQRAAEEIVALSSETAGQKKTRSKKEKKDKKEKSKKTKKEEKRKKKGSKGEDNLILGLVDQSQEKTQETPEAATHMNGISDSSREKVSNVSVVLYRFFQCLISNRLWGFDFCVLYSSSGLLTILQ